MLPILLALSLCTIVCFKVVSFSTKTMRKIISEPSLTVFATRKHSPSLSCHRKNSSSVSVTDARRGYSTELSESNFAGNAEIPENPLHAEPLRCSSSHEGRELINIILPVSVDAVFQLLFTASKFQRDFFLIRKTFDIEYGQWKEGENEGEKIRKLSYHVQLNNPLGSFCYFLYWIRIRVEYLNGTTHSAQQNCQLCLASSPDLPPPLETSQIRPRSGLVRSFKMFTSLRAMREYLVMSKKSLHDLVQEVDPHEQLDEDVEDALLQIADQFIENLVSSSCMLAKHRKSSSLEVQDVQLVLERHWNMWIPGFGTEDIKSVKKSASTEAHRQRMAIIRKTLKK
ncbi:unnamed protein product [Darwinula stevensoni]|uniref:Transcription initiation factor TFIID subunit 12 n=1 Tax=Darwinula stevensoni TaxID=69355 RepID=A0A7R8X977_9CRUS|nr:unnamed protein product [Darwinula stevensoni]CAG0890850.1 unnamed protein product [Darwinula stevensoni]